MVNLFPQQPLRTLLGLSGIVGLGVLFVKPPKPVEVGELPAVHARPAELAQVRALGEGQTLDEILGEFADDNERQNVLLAFQEQASPRRMRVGAEITLRYRLRAED